MRQDDVHEVKTELSRLLEAVEAGERIVIARAGEPVAILAPLKSAVRMRRLGLFPGEAKLHADFDVLPADIVESLGSGP
jgi:prevent-host-death family protein